MIEKDLSLVCPASDNPVLNNFTMGPNWIYDTVMVKESLSVIKVVSYINRATTGRTGRDGKRVEVVQASYEWIARKMEMSVRAVGTAMRQAIAQGYIIQVKAGRLAEKDKPAEGGWYALNWNWSATSQNYYVKLEGIKPALAETVETEDSANMPEVEQIVPVNKPQARKVLQGGARQNLPGSELKAQQILPPCNNKVSKINNQVEIKAQVKDTLRPVNSTENKNEQANSEQENSKRKGSTAIGRLISDFTREFGDSDSLALPNISRALNLWRKSGLDEQEFISLVYQARQKTKLSGSVQHRRMAANGSASDLPNRMPYFFAVLSELISSPQRTQSSGFRVPGSEFRVELKDRFDAQVVQFAVEDMVLVTESSQGVAESAQENEVVEAEVDQENSIGEVEDASDDSAVWQKVVKGLGWISESKREALTRAELLPVEQFSRTRARFELKFARQWHKGLFEQRDLDRLALALGAELGESLNGDMLLLS